ncbi:50S ribosomal protein L21 [Candidatus Erwinia haradaeae]|uniref:Large ribosomal subunit protein bL21 n=1 Tax=Candidatus Erwinia haradaeae TaxID=1922217 RepID=A0A803FT26_9GAMM|nr:50S ribosomal protein L21 [Candidatus Erwinia haradaeae]VFP87533.1 50S ribosomal protein L21 [Candidatus Erwinia haradaeae]
MYAVFKSGGKQYRVREGQIIRLEKFDYSSGEKITFNEVLMVAHGLDVKIGSPIILGGSIDAEVLASGHGKKIKIVKFRARKHYHKQQGHRQDFTDVKIIRITSGGEDLNNGA